MEYGLMLGFNKYVIPFQKEEQKLPFNVAGLDTVKYDQKNFEDKAISALDQAIELTKQDTTKPLPVDNSDLIQTFFLSRDLLMTSLDTQTERDLYRLGEPLGFNLLNDFAGKVCTFFGGFASFRPEIVIWRIRKLDQILCARLKSIPERKEALGITDEMEKLGRSILEDARILVCVTSQMDKEKIVDAMGVYLKRRNVEVLTLDEARAEIAEAVQ